MIRRPTNSSRADPRSPDTALFRSEYADSTATKRSYSLATIQDHAIGAGDAVEIAVSYVAGGAVTALFEGLDEGDHVEASGPFGRFCLMPADEIGRAHV